jgi:hypothetical protein
MFRLTWCVFHRPVGLGRSILVEVGISCLCPTLPPDFFLEADPIVTCHACGLKQCFKHKAPWHEGLTCQQWDEKVKQDAIEKSLTDELVKITTKPCPKEGCGRRVILFAINTFYFLALTIISR